jgi:hypothetical protein
VHHRVDTVHAAPYTRSIRDRADDTRAGRFEHVEADQLVPVVAEAARESLAEMPGAACQEDAHASNGLSAEVRAVRLILRMSVEKATGYAA